MSNYKKSSINSDNLVSPRVTRVVRLFLGIILIASLFNRILHSWNSDIPAMLYFTVLINMFVGVYYIITSFFQRLRSNTVTHALTTYILIIGSVFMIFLNNGFVHSIYAKLSEKSINPAIHYISMTNSILTHYIMPIIAGLDYFVLTDMRKTKVDYKILILPVMYLIASLIYGLVTGQYPYPFLNVEYVGGWLIFALLIIVFTLVFLVVSFIIKKLNCKIQNRIESYFSRIV